MAPYSFSMNLGAAWWRRLRSADQRVLDSTLALVLALATVADWSLGSHPVWQLPLHLLVVGSVLARHRYPLLALAVPMALGIGFSIGPEGFIALGVNAYSVGVSSGARWRTLLVFAFGGIVFFRDWSPFLLILMAWLLGITVRDRRAAEAALERERAAGDRGALRERARIARDLHDVVAHAVSVIVVQAEAARNLLHRDLARAEQAIDAVSASGREALAELRQLLTVLGTVDEPPSLTPSPGTADIDQLVERVRAAGQPIEIRVEGHPTPLDPTVSLAAYRIVQEALTNAVRYARGARTDVRVTYHPDRLVVEVLDHGNGQAAPEANGSGSGLRGLRERVAIVGGELAVTRTDDGGFAVRASLPYQPA